MNLAKLALNAALLLTPLVMQSARIVVLADVHVTPGNECETKLKEAVTEINLIDADAVIMNGDLTNEGSNEQLKNVKSILDEIKHPLYVLPGNHETNWSQSATKTFVDLWGNDRFVTEIDSLILVGINCGPYMKMGDGHIKQEDLHWLKATLDKRVSSGKRVISFNHYPLMNDLDNYVDYIKVLEQYPVIAHINGHYHKYEHYQSGDIDGMMVRSLDRKKGDFGYTIMDVTADSVIFSNKQLGHEPVRVEAFAAKRNLSPVKTDKAASIVNPDGFEINCIHADSASIFTRLAIDNKAIYFGNSIGEVKAIDKTTGNTLWKLPTGASMFSRSAVIGNNIIIPSANKELLIADNISGKILKRIPSKGPYVADGFIYGNSLYQGGYMKMEKWNAETGELLWRFDSIDNYCQAAPVVDRNDLIFGAWDSYLYCLDSETGKLRWKWNNGKKSNMLGPGNVVPVVTDDKVIIVAPDRYMTAIDRKTGKELWRNKDFKYRESLGCSIDKSRAYAKTMDGELVAIDTGSDSFKLLWVIDMKLGYEHAPCIVAESNGIVYAGSRRGIISAIDPISQRMLWSLPLGVSEVNGIDIDPINGDIYLSLIEGTIWHIHKTH